MRQISQASTSKFVLISGGLSSDNTSGGDGGNIEPMEARVAKLESVIPTLATKIDIADLRTEIARLEVGMHKEFNAQTWKFITWMTGICTALIAATYFIAKH